MFLVHMRHKAMVRISDVHLRILQEHSSRLHWTDSDAGNNDEVFFIYTLPPSLLLPSSTTSPRLERSLGVSSPEPSVPLD